MLHYYFLLDGLETENAELHLRAIEDGENLLIKVKVGNVFKYHTKQGVFIPHGAIINLLHRTQ